jgi:hypothetical protein
VQSAVQRGCSLFKVAFLDDGARLLVPGTEQLNPRNSQARAVLHVDNDPALLAQLQLLLIQIFHGAGGGPRQRRDRSFVFSTGRTADDGDIRFLTH